MRRKRASRAYLGKRCDGDGGAGIVVRTVGGHLNGVVMASAARELMTAVLCGLGGATFINDPFSALTLVP